MLRIFVLFTTLLLTVAFNTRTFLPRRVFQLSSNRIDGLTIEGDLKPLSSNVLVKVKDSPSSTAGGLYLPTNSKTRLNEGYVVAVGPGIIHPETGVLLNMSVKVGQNVMFGKFNGAELKYNDKNHVLVEDEDILLTYSGEDATLENVECVNDKVLVKLPTKKESNLSNVLISPVMTDSPTRESAVGVVMKVGRGRQAVSGMIMPMHVQPGDGVKFRDYGANNIKIGADEFTVLRAYDILAKW